MKVLLRALLLIVAFVFALGIVKWLFFKLFFFALALAVIGFIVFALYSIIKPAT